MTTPYKFITDLARQIEVPEDGTLSRTLFQDDNAKVVLFGFAAGQELSEHTASMPAILQFLEGEAEVGLGNDCVAANAGDWIHMAAGLTHSIVAKSSVVMLLVLLKSGAATT